MRKFYLSLKKWLISLVVCIVWMTETVSATEHAKYVFLFIGDGMAETQITAAEILKSAIKSDDYQPRPLSFTMFEHVGLMHTYSDESYIVDSASAATAMAGGVVTKRGVIGLERDLMTKITSITKLAKEKGFKVGIVSNMPLNHATPSAFYAHVPSRFDYQEIGYQMATSAIDYFGGGGLVDEDKGSDKSIESFLKLNGYDVLKTKEQMESYIPSDRLVYVKSPHLTENESLPYEIDRDVHELDLAYFVKKGVSLLENENGFLMIVESGLIDKAAHAHDAVSMCHELFGFEKAIVEAITFAVNHPDETLIIVTGDHETGGLSLGHKDSEGLQFEHLLQQKMSTHVFHQKFEDVLTQYPTLHFDAVLKLIEAQFGLVKTNQIHPLALTESELLKLELAFEASKLDDLQLNMQIYGGNDPLTVTCSEILNEKAGIGYNTFAHTAHPVSVYATGVNAALFDGRYHQYELYDKLVEAMGL